MTCVPPSSQLENKKLSIFPLFTVTFVVVAKPTHQSTTPYQPKDDQDTSIETKASVGEELY
jgi:hypothetical protein